MPKLVALLFSGCVGLDLGFTGGFNFRGREYPQLHRNIVCANDGDVDVADLLWHTK